MKGTELVLKGYHTYTYIREGWRGMGNGRVFKICERIILCFHKIRLNKKLVSRPKINWPTEGVTPH